MSGGGFTRTGPSEEEGWWQTYGTSENPLGDVGKGKAWMFKGQCLLSRETESTLVAGGQGRRISSGGGSKPSRSLE